MGERVIRSEHGHRYPHRVAEQRVEPLLDQEAAGPAARQQRQLDLDRLPLAHAPRQLRPGGADLAPPPRCGDRRANHHDGAVDEDVERPAAEAVGGDPSQEGHGGDGHACGRQPNDPLEPGQRAAACRLPHGDRHRTGRRRSGRLHVAVAARPHRLGDGHRCGLYARAAAVRAGASSSTPSGTGTLPRIRCTTLSTESSRSWASGVRIRRCDSTGTTMARTSSG